MANRAGPDAFTFIVVADEFPDRIESICPWNDRVYAGFSGGSVACLESELELHELCPWRIEKRVNGPNRKPVLQIEPLSSLSALMSLTQLGLHVHSIPGFNIITKIDAPGASRFAWNDQLSILCINVRRALNFYTLDGSNFKEITTVPVTDIVRLMVWCGRNLCYATKTRYAFIDYTSGQTVESIIVGRGSPAMAAISDEEVLLTKDNQSFYVSPDGQSRNVAITWSQPPHAIVLCEPFVVGILDSYMEVRNKSPTARKCVIQMFNDVDRINITSPNLAIDGSIFVASRERRTLSRLYPTPLKQQIGELMEVNEFQDALEVAKLLDDDVQTNTEENIRLSYGIHLFMNKKYDEGLYQLGNRSQPAPLLILRLFPSLLPKELREGFVLPVSEDFFANYIEPEGDEFAAAVDCLQPLLEGYRNRLASRQRDDMEDDQPDDGMLGAIDEEEEIGDEGVPEPGKLKRMHIALSSRMESRVRRSRVAVLVDTAIMNAMLVSPDSGTLLRFVKNKNFIDIEEGERALTSSGRYIELSGLYESHKMHDKGLEVLRRVSLEREKLEYPPRGASKDLKGETSVWAAIRYLSNLTEDDEAVIKKHSSWVLKEDPQAALEVFVGAEKRLPPHIVLPILSRYAPQYSAIYLEAMLDRGDASRDEYEMTLVNIYLKDAIKNEAELGPLHKLSNEDHQFDFSMVNEKSSRRLQEMGNVFEKSGELVYDDMIKAKQKPEFLTSSEPLNPLESYWRLKELLNTSPFIDTNQTYNAIPQDTLLELQALLLERQRNYRSALSVYSQRLHDLTLAEMLCDRVWESKHDSGTSVSTSLRKLETSQTFDFSERSENVYMDMIAIYLEPEKMTDGPIRKLTDDEWRDLCVLLCRNLHRINIEEMFEMLPGDVELSVLMQFVEGAVRILAEQQRNLLIINNLYQAENIRKEELFTCCKQRYIGVTYESACCFCHKRIGSAVFVAYPDGSLAHVACYSRETKSSTPTAGSSSDTRSAVGSRRSSGMGGGGGGLMSRRNEF